MSPAQVAAPMVSQIAVAALLALAVAGVMPTVVGRLPEPAPEAEPDLATAAHPEVEPPKELYADLGRLRVLRVGVPIASVLLALVVTARVNGGFPALMWAALIPPLLALSVIDWRTHLLPTRILLPLTLGVMAVGAVVAGVSGEWQPWVRAMIAMLVLRSFFWVLWRIRRAGMGFGDVRLAALLGFALGWLGVAEVVVGLYAAFIGFAVPALVVLVVRRDKRVLKAQVPFGPFLVAGALVGVLAGPQIIGWLGYGG